MGLINDFLGSVFENPFNKNKKKFSPKHTRNQQWDGPRKAEIVKALENYTFICALNYITNTFCESESYVSVFDKETRQWIEDKSVNGDYISDILRYPSLDYSKHSYWFNILNNLFAHGVAFSNIILDEPGGMPLYFGPIDTRNTRLDIDLETNNIHSILVGDNEPLKPEDCLIFRKGLDPTTLLKGIGIENYGSRVMALDNNSLELVYYLTKQLGLEVVVISPKGDVEFLDDDMSGIGATYKDKTTGIHRGEPVVMNSAMDIHKIGSKITDLEMQRLFSATVSKVCSWFPIDPVLLAIGDENSAYNSKIDAKQNFYDSFLIPLHQSIDADLSRQLLPRFYPKWKSYKIARSYSSVMAVQRSIERQSVSISKLYQTGVIDRAKALAKIFTPFTKEDIGVYYTVKQVQILDGTDPDLEAKLLQED